MISILLKGIFPNFLEIHWNKWWLAWIRFANLTSVPDQKKVYFEIHTQPYTFFEISRCEDSKNDSGKIRLINQTRMLVFFLSVQFRFLAHGSLRTMSLCVCHVWSYRSCFKKIFSPLKSFKILQISMFHPSLTCLCVCVSVCLCVCPALNVKVKC